MDGHSLRSLLIDAAAAGATLDELERDVIERADGMDDDERAAAWLFAWHHTSDPQLRRAGGELAVLSRT